MKHLYNLRPSATPLAAMLAMSAVGAVAAVSVLAGCSDDKKEARDCTPGTLDCTCAADSTCDAGLSCLGGICQSQQTANIEVSNAEVRACDLLLEEADGQVVGVDYDEALRGTHVRQAPQTAVSFVQRADAAIPPASVKVRYAGGTGTNVTLVKTSCFDAAGTALAEPGVSLAL